MSKKRAVGRPRIYLEPRVRRNLNIERNEVFDENLENARRTVAAWRGLSFEQITNREAVSIAIHLLAYGEMPPK